MRIFSIISLAMLGILTPKNVCCQNFQLTNFKEYYQVLDSYQQKYLQSSLSIKTQISVYQEDDFLKPLSSVHRNVILNFDGSFYLESFDSRLIFDRNLTVQIDSINEVIFILPNEHASLKQEYSYSKLDSANRVLHKREVERDGKIFTTYRLSPLSSEIIQGCLTFDEDYSLLESDIVVINRAREVDTAPLYYTYRTKYDFLVSKSGMPLPLKPSDLIVKELDHYKIISPEFQNYEIIDNTNF